jgi:DNA sulfur modification protein DndB
MSENTLGQLVVPALKARMGDWSYYIGFLQFRDVADRISVAEEIHVADSLKELLQRGLRDRAPEIAAYLHSQAQRFFNALVVGTYGGHPQWYEVEIKSSSRFNAPLPDYVKGALGLLVLSGSETMFAIDGQHRVAGIRKAIDDDEGLSAEEVAVIFIKGVSASKREHDPEGFERTRRLFTTLNSRAKSVSKKDIIALDEDDLIAIVTRRLIEKHRLFAGKVYSKGVKSIPRTNSSDLTTVVALYDALDALFIDDITDLPLQKRKRPDDHKIDSCYSKSVSWYQHLTNVFPPLREVLNSSPEERVAGRYRGANGGHILFRPIGFVMVHRVGLWLLRSGKTVKEVTKLLSKVPTDLSKQPWTGLLWDKVNKRMLYGAENRRAAERLLFHSLGGDLRDQRTTPTELRTEISGLLNKEPNQVHLPKYIK